MASKGQRTRKAVTPKGMQTADALKTRRLAKVNQSVNLKRTLEEIEAELAEHSDRIYNVLMYAKNPTSGMTNQITIDDKLSPMADLTPWPNTYTRGWRLPGYYLGAWLTTQDES